MSQQMQQPQPTAEAEIQQADAVTTFVEALATAVGVETVFGEPVTAGDRVVIPVAETTLGGGAGYGQGPAAGEGQPPRRYQFSTGAGAGGRAGTRPVAAIIVTPEEVRVQPILDLGKLALTGITTSAVLWQGLAALIKTIRRRS